jgi:hypothetical protein
MTHTWFNMSACRKVQVVGRYLQIVRWCMGCPSVLNHVCVWLSVSLSLCLFFSLSPSLPSSPPSLPPSLPSLPPSFCLCLPVSCMSQVCPRCGPLAHGTRHPSDALVPVLDYVRREPNRGQARGHFLCLSPLPLCPSITWLG